MQTLAFTVIAAGLVLILIANIWIAIRLSQLGRPVLALGLISTMVCGWVPGLGSVLGLVSFVVLVDLALKLRHEAYREVFGVPMYTLLAGFVGAALGFTLLYAAGGI